MTKTTAHDKYRRIEVRLLRHSEGAIRVAKVADVADSHSNVQGAEGWIPRTLFAFHSEQVLDSLAPGGTAEVEVREWKLRELGFI